MTPGFGRLGPPTGLSLLEAVVAVAIVGITAVGALEAVGGDMRTAEHARRAIEAEALANSRLEFMDLLTQDRDLQSLPDTVAHGKFEKPLDEYSWTTTSAPDADQAGIYKINVTIAWPTGSYAVHTMAFRRPPLVTNR